jgi:hypothetical protein
MKKASEEPIERNSAKLTLQLLTINTTVRKINNEVCAVTFAQVYEGKIFRRLEALKAFC